MNEPWGPERRGGGRNWDNQWQNNNNNQWNNGQQWGQGDGQWGQGFQNWNQQDRPRGPERTTTTTEAPVPSPPG